MWIRVEETLETGRRRMAPGATGSWLQFGRQTLVYTAEEPPTAGAGGRTDTTGWRHVPATPAALHIVIQHGRRFQQHHPDVPVLHDRGRFLLVELDAAAAARLAGIPETCYRILPAASEMVVFEERARTAAAARDPCIDAVLNGLTADQTRATIERLAGFHTRHSTSASFLNAATFLGEQLRGLGYRVSTTPVAVGPGQSQNLVAEKSGSGSSPRNVVLVTAHLDSVNADDGAAAPAPGADDNASGSAGVMAMARALAAVNCRDDLRFILFGGEEQGLLGSEQQVRRLGQAERQRIIAVVNMDMIGCRNAGPRTVLLEGAPVSQSIIDGLAEAAAAYTSLQVETSLQAANSDHVPFIRANIPAVLTIEGADSTNHRVHTARDTVDTIDYDLLIAILRMNVAFVLNAAGRLP